MRVVVTIILGVDSLTIRSGIKAVLSAVDSMALINFDITVQSFGLVMLLLEHEVWDDHFGIC